MSAYVAIQSFSVNAPDGNGQVTVPIGARVEEGDYYHSAFPEAFRPEDTGQFFGRVNPANGQIETTNQAPPLDEETKVEAPAPAPETQSPAPSPAPEAKTSGSGPKSSAGRSRPPLK